MKSYIDFINSLTSAKVVVFSRPLKTNVCWKTIILDNWSFDETSAYLESEYKITDYSLVKDIYSVTDGYPIITYFVAEEYKLTQKLAFDCKLNSINQYYDSLLDNISIRTPLTLFATNNSFFLYSELEMFLDEEIFQALNEFIESYPFLFKQSINRYSLMHDSLNTYLRNNLTVYNYRKKLVSEKVKNSLLSGEVRYMSRLMSFDFEEDFFDELLQLYSSFDVLNNLLESTIDFNSITDFYNQLQLILEKRTETLDIYQLYSFALIHQSVNRNDILGFEGVAFQILLYINRNGNAEEYIYSSGAMWNLFALIKSNNEIEYKRFLSNKNYSQEALYDVYYKINISKEFFNTRNLKIDFESFETDLIDHKKSSIDKKNILINYLVSVWINNEKNRYCEIVNEFLYNDERKAIESLLNLTRPYNIEKMWISIVLNAVRYKLHELGYFEDNNMFRNISIKELISIHSQKGSFAVMEYIESYLRLLNYEERETDICSINKAWIMHCNRKDHSVYTLDVALINFERHALIKSSESLEIIRRAMAQSEKGIRLLMTTYFNEKPLSFTDELIKQGFFEDDTEVSFFELDSAHINCFDEEFVQGEVIKLLIHHRGKVIEFRDIENIISSKYKDMMLNYLKYYEYNVFGIYDNMAFELLESVGIKCFKQKEVAREYVPFEHGCIHENDREYILNNQVPYTEICCYTDGWYNAFPLIELYSLYERAAIKNDYLKIIHKAMFARTSTIQCIGNWSLLLGNIPSFLSQSEIDIDWRKLFVILKQFLNISLIWIELGNGEL